MLYLSLRLMSPLSSSVRHSMISAYSRLRIVQVNVHTGDVQRLLLGDLLVLHPLPGRGGENSARVHFFLLSMSVSSLYAEIASRLTMSDGVKPPVASSSIRPPFS